MPLLIPAYVLRCCGDVPGSPDYCCMVSKCARYLATASDPHDGSTRIRQRVCKTTWLDRFMPVPNDLRKERA